MIQMPGLQPLARGTQFKLELLHWDEVDLSVQARVLEVVALEVLPSEVEEDELAVEEAEATTEVTIEATTEAKPVDPPAVSAE